MTEDLDRLRLEYAYRARRLILRDKYTLFHPPYLFTFQQRQRHVLRLLYRHGVHTLSGKRILEVGCGHGGVLHEFLGFRADPSLLTGIDLLPYRVHEAHCRMPGLSLACADAQHLPYAASSFDIVMQYTMFSSILDPQIRANIAREMLRVLRKPHGLILWYDFWLNPTNSQTRGIRPAEIRQLFPDCVHDFYRVTLAPPITQYLIRFSWTACLLLEKLKLFNTHYLAAIRPA